MLQFSVGKMRCEGTVFQLNAEKLTLVPNKLARTVGFAACQLTPYKRGGASCNFNVSDHGEHHPLRQVGRLPAQRAAVSNNQWLTSLPCLSIKPAQMRIHNIASGASEFLPRSAGAICFSALASSGACISKKKCMSLMLIICTSDKFV